MFNRIVPVILIVFIAIWAMGCSADRCESSSDCPGVKELCIDGYCHNVDGEGAPYKSFCNPILSAADSGCDATAEKCSLRVDEESESIVASCTKLNGIKTLNQICDRNSPNQDCNAGLVCLFILLRGGRRKQPDKLSNTSCCFLSVCCNPLGNKSTLYLTFQKGASGRCGPLM